MDVPTIPNVLMLDAGESLEDQVFVRGDLLDAESIDIYFKNTQYKLLNVFDVVTAKLRNHISDTFCHTNPIEKRYWNNKVDTSRYEAAMSIVQERLHALEEIIKGVPGEVDFSSFITYNKLIDILSNRDSWPLEIDGYVKEGGKLGTINGVDFYQGASITIGSVDPDDPDAPSTSKSYKVTGLSYNNGQITLSQENNPNSPYRINVPTSEVDQTTINNITNQVANSISYTANITSSTANSYKIGTLNVGTNNHFDLYGKDTYGSEGSPNPYTLPVASENELGGIKLGYPQNGKNYPVQLDGFSQAFVNVPWGDVESATGYWELIFKAVYGESAPSLPSNFDSNPDGWSHSAENNDGSKTVWMANRWVNGAGVAGSWNGPWRISGKNGVDGQDGENGVDGTEYEYIYKTTTTQDAPSLVSGAVQTDDYVPTGWNDNPSGVDQTNRYEWMAFRTKTFSTNDPDGTWSQFYGPVLWSSYGRNGTDGDGIEYIFYLDATGEKTFPSNASDNPITWTNDSGFQEREYIKANTDWTDDPSNMTTRGSKQYVSVRKRYADNEGENPYWHAYSQPALWSYYAKDGNIDDFDTSEILDKIDEFQNAVDNLENNINDIVQTDVENTLTRANWIRENFPTEELVHTSGWDEITENFVSTVGYVDANNSVTWSDFVQGVDTITSRVNAVIDNNNTIKSSVFNQALQGTDLYTYYANLNDDGQILKYLIAGFKTEATGTGSSAAQYAQASTANSKGLATLITRVQTAEGNIQTVQAGLTSKWTGTTSDIENIVDNRAGVVATSTANSAIASLFAQGVSGSTNAEKLSATISAVVRGDQSLIELVADEVDIEGYLTAGDATFKGDVEATTFAVIDGNDNHTIEFTTYNSSTMASIYPAIAQTGISDGTPIGIIFNPQSHTAEYFFDFAPVDPGTFSVTPELTYRITQGATGKVNIVAGPIVYKITECTKDSSKIGKYVTPAVNEGSINYMSPLINRSDLYQAFETRNLIVRSGNTYNIVRCQIWKKVNFAGGVKSEYISGNEQRGYITELQDNSNIGNGINAYNIAGTEGNAQTMSEQYSSFTKYMVSGNSEISSSVVYNSQYDVYELNTGDAVAAMIGSNNNSNTTDIVQYNVFVPSSYIRKQSSIIV